MSFFFDFCFVAFLLWLVIFVASLFFLDGDWSLMFYAKFGKKIRKFALLVYIFLSVDSWSSLLFWLEFEIPTESLKEFRCRLVHWQGSDHEKLEIKNEIDLSKFLSEFLKNSYRTNQMALEFFKNSTAVLQISDCRRRVSTLASGIDLRQGINVSRAWKIWQK